MPPGAPRCGCAALWCGSPRVERPRTLVEGGWRSGRLDRGIGLLLGHRLGRRPSERDQRQQQVVLHPRRHPIQHHLHRALPPLGQLPSRASAAAVGTNRTSRRSRGSATRRNNPVASSRSHRRLADEGTTSSSSANPLTLVSCRLLISASTRSWVGGTWGRDDAESRTAISASAAASIAAARSVDRSTRCPLPSSRGCLPSGGDPHPLLRSPGPCQSRQTTTASSRRSESAW